MSFTATLERFPGKGGWTHVVVPEGEAPPITRGWGRTPVVAEVDGRRWDATAWRDKQGVTMMAIPKKHRGGKEAGDTVTVAILGLRDSA